MAARRRTLICVPSDQVANHATTRPQPKKHHDIEDKRKTFASRGRLMTKRSDVNIRQPRFRHETLPRAVTQRNSPVSDICRLRHDTQSFVSPRCRQFSTRAPISPPAAARRRPAVVSAHASHARFRFTSLSARRFRPSATCHVVACRQQRRHAQEACRLRRCRYYALFYDINVPPVSFISCRVQPQEYPDLFIRLCYIQS